MALHIACSRFRWKDYYDEGTLIWLDVHTTLRRLTNDQRVIDDFCKRFMGDPEREPELKTCTFDDVVACTLEIRGFMFCWGP